MKHTILLSILLIITINLFAQKEVKDANSFFDNQDYIVALKSFERLYVKDTTNIEMNYKMGVSYLNCNSNPKKALKHLLYVQKNKKPDDFIYLFELGWAYMNNLEFDKALETLQKSKNYAIKNPEFIAMIDLKIAHINNAKKFYKKPLDVSFYNLGKYINSTMDDITPVISAQDGTLFFTNNQRFDRTYQIYTFDVYYSMLTKKGYAKARPLAGANSVEDEFVAGVSAIGNNLFVQLQTYEAFEDLAVIEKNGKRFGKKEILRGNVNTKSKESAATLSITGDTLFFSSNTGSGKGGVDLFMSRRLPNGEWAEPKNLGNTINTKYDEDFPVLMPDGKTMYFCSNNTKSMGGFDVFKTKLLPNGEWAEPKNIGYPLNDVYDNKTIAFSSDRRYAYMSKNLEDSYGYNDIYRVVFNDKDPSVKLVILKLKTGNNDNSTDFSVSDTTLKIIAKKEKKVFGKYVYTPNTSQVTMALLSGDYIIEIVGDKTQKYILKINIPDTPGTPKIIRRNVFLQLKK